MLRNAYEYKSSKSSPAAFTQVLRLVSNGLLGEFPSDSRGAVISPELPDPNIQDQDALGHSRQGCLQAIPRTIADMAKVLESECLRDSGFSRKAIAGRAQRTHEMPGELRPLAGELARATTCVLKDP